jgi:hypothetical protein
VALCVRVVLFSGSVRKFERSRMLFVCAVCALQLFRVGFLSLWGVQATDSVILGASGGLCCHLHLLFQRCQWFVATS